MKNSIIAILLLMMFGCSRTREASSVNNEFEYAYHLDLQELRDDQLEVSLSVRGLDQETVTFCFPRIVPGIYGEMNFGQYISALTAVDDEGNLLEARKTDRNCWEILKAKDLGRVSYRVDDSWEEFDFNLSEDFYRSSASTFKPGAFVINNNCLFGYIEGLEDRPVKLTVEKPEALYAATSLNREEAKTTPDKDVFSAEDYYKLVDNPILYSVPDTTLIKLPGIEVEVACYSTSQEGLSKEIARYIKPLLENQSKYLGGKLPVSNYSFLIYHNLNPEPNAYMGDGLEHSNSTLILFYMPMDLDILKESIYGIASHEFFHILMPLGLHSHEIADYDFNDPAFSKHLWLYEGMTEYFTIHMPIKNKIQSLEEFIQTIERKVKEMKDFDNSIPFTELSLNAMKMQDQYYNVYLKGALINLCLDIRLRELSEGKYGVQQLIFDLIGQYGKDTPFEDDELFDEMARITGFSEVKAFTDQYIEGSKPLPLKETLQRVGLRLDVQKGEITVAENVTAEQRKLRGYWIGQ